MICDHIVYVRMYRFIFTCIYTFYTWLYICLVISLILGLRYSFILFITDNYKNGCWKVHMMTSCLLLLTFLTNGIQSLQHQWKKCENQKETILKNSSHLIPFYERILVSLWIFQPNLIKFCISFFIWVKCTCAMKMLGNPASFQIIARLVQLCNLCRNSFFFISK